MEKQEYIYTSVLAAVQESNRVLTEKQAASECLYQETNK